MSRSCLPRVHRRARSADDLDRDPVDRRGAARACISSHDLRRTLEVVTLRRSQRVSLRRTERPRPAGRPNASTAIAAQICSRWSSWTVAGHRAAPEEREPVASSTPRLDRCWTTANDGLHLPADGDIARVPRRIETEKQPSPSTKPTIQSWIEIDLAFPADCPHRMDFHCSCVTLEEGETYERVPPDTRSFQHIARFCTHGITLMRVLRTVIVTAAVYRGLGSELRSRRS